MKNLLRYLTATTLILVFTAGQGWGQILTFEFSALGGSEVTATSNSNDPNLTSSTISRGAGLTASGNGGRFNATSWAVTSIANAVTGNDYMEFAITPQSGYQFSVSSIVVQWQRSSTGNTAISLRSSVDSYGSDLDAVKNVTDNTSTQTFTWTFTQANSSTAVTYRLYSYAEATGGTGGPGDGTGNDIVVSGTTSAISSGPATPTALTINETTSDKMNITWTKPTGTFGTDWDGVVVFLADGNTGFDITDLYDEGDVAINADGVSFDVQTVDGSEYSYDGTTLDIGYCIANQTTDADGSVTVSGLTEGDTYYLIAYTYKTITGDDNDEWSALTYGGSGTLTVPEITDFTVTPGNQQLDLSWNNPTGAVNDYWDKVIIIAREGQAVEADINKTNFDDYVDGLVDAESNWSASPGHADSDVYGQTYLGSVSTNYFVYNNTGGAKASVSITGLAASTAYHFKAMVYYLDGTSSDVWSTGVTGDGTTFTPTISLSETSLSGFFYLEGSGPSAEQEFDVSGSNLTNNITFTLPTNYEISETSGSGFSTPVVLTPDGNGAVGSTTIYVRLKAGLSAGSYDSEVITAVSSGATSKTVTCDGDVVGSVSLPFTDDFATGKYIVTLGGEGSDGAGDYFMKTDGSNINKTYTGATGNFFAGQDIDDGGWAGSASPSELTWSYLDISSITDVEFSCDFASLGGGIDDADYVRYEYQVDDGSWLDLISFRNKGGSNTNFWEDTDFNGIGDGTQLTSAFATFTKVFSVSGSLLNVRVRIALNSADEEFAIENLSIKEVEPDPEPTNHPTIFTATTNGTSQIDLSWTDAVGAQLPEGYLIKGSTSTPLTAPIDGTDPVEDTDLSDGSAVVKVAHGSGGTYSFTGLTASTTYYFQIWSYTNSGNNIDFLTDPVGPTDDATTSDPPAIVINEIHADPHATLGDANGDGSVSATQDEFIELYNNSNAAINITGYKIKDAVGTTHVFPANSYIEPNDVFVVFSGGNPTGFDNLDVQTASTGSLGLSNTGDDVILTDAEDVVQASYTYGLEAINDQSITRDPDVTGSFVDHSTATGSGGALFSPAKRIDNTFFKKPTVWTGAAKSNVWDASGNWSVEVPTVANRAVIPSSLSTYPTIEAAASCNSLHMKDGATLIGGEYLTINGTAKVQKNITGYTGTDDGWQIITSPLNGAAIPGSDWVPVADEDDFYAYDEAANIWRNYLDNNPGWFNTFGVGTGYLTAYHTNNDGDKNFISGSLNSDASYVLSLGKAGTGWNFLGNPYPSKIEFDGLVFSNAGSMKTMDITDGSYDDVITGDDIDICQGFIVWASSTPATLTIDIADQTHGSAKKAGGEINRMKLIASSPESMVHIWLAVNETSTTDFEWQTDSKYLAPYTDLPRLSMLTSDEVEVSTNSFNISGESVVIPVSFTVLQDETITFSLEDFSTSLGVKDVIIEDQSNNTFTTLSDGVTYTFDASTGDDPMRFKLHVNGATGINDPASSDWMNIYSSGSTIYLNSSNVQEATVKVYNNLGQIVASRQLNVDGLTSFDVQAQTGWYVVRVVADGTAIAKKVFIN